MRYSEKEFKVEVFGNFSGTVLFQRMARTAGLDKDQSYFILNLEGVRVEGGDELVSKSGKGRGDTGGGGVFKALISKPG